MTPQEFLEQKADFTWLWSADYFLETAFWNFKWSSPDYPGGDNTITYTSKSYDEHMRDIKPLGALLFYGRDKGTKIIGNYCGRDVVFTKATIGRLSALEVPRAETQDNG